MKTRRTKIFLIIGVLLALYALGYVRARRNYQVVHYISFGAAGEYTKHDVSGGDGKLLGAAVNAAVSAFYTPLRYLEIGWWHLAHPLGTPLTEVHKQRTLFK